jgi:hypothetical protein
LLNLYCLQHQEDGDVTHLPAERIAQICRWPIPAKAEEFVGALKCAGVLDEQELPGGGVRYVVHNFRHYCRRVLNERERKRTQRQTGRGQDSHQEQTPTQTVRGVSAPVSADKVAPNVNGTVNGNVKERERPLTAVTAARPEPAQSEEPAGASRPSEKQGQENGNSPKTATAGKPAPMPAARSMSVQERISLFAELLRRWGWNETQVRRLLKWLISDFGNGRWVQTASEGDFWNVLAHVKYIEERAAYKKDVRDPVSFLIHLMDKNFTPNQMNFNLAKAAWIYADEEGERTEPIWMREVLASIGGGGK